MTSKAKALLKRLDQTEDGSLRLTKSNAKVADELKEAGLVSYIAISTGGAWVALTQKGSDECERLWPE